jgi:hypothetical protein
MVGGPGEWVSKGEGEGEGERNMDRRINETKR